MKILFLAPQPFYQERGTPIAVRLALEVLEKRIGDRIALLTYHEGTAVPFENVETYRIPAVPLLKNISPGVSLKKIACDIVFFFSVCKLLLRHRKEQFDLLHAVEESVFMALFFKLTFGIPYVYDMDSSLAHQVVEKWKWASWLYPVLHQIEKFAIRNAMAVIPVCDALADIAEEAEAEDIQIVRDISLLNRSQIPLGEISDIRSEANIANDALVALYVGNLENYQGIDLLLESFALIASDLPDSHCVIIGGTPEHITMYQNSTVQLGIAKQVHFLGSKPVEHLKGYLEQANILLSPRTLGTNTPMKIYSYLHAGIPTLATRLPTHTQLLHDAIASLADPSPSAFAKELKTLFSDKDYRSQLAQAAFAEAESKYTFEVFHTNLNGLYDRLQTRLRLSALKPIAEDQQG